ncbi:hypothetical protein RRG08_047077 [Elysia crispata]|uniref:Uncharacterized protein n=1 Tax=Elysia crispata TaxID=231223 RepID=A0AAE1AAC2_9GAST|nr:hypothetical protein RRG08_047077 [Elysia crispata]
MHTISPPLPSPPPLLPSTETVSPHPGDVQSSAGNKTDDEDIRARAKDAYQPNIFSNQKIKPMTKISETQRCISNPTFLKAGNKTDDEDIRAQAKDAYQTQHFSKQEIKPMTKISEHKPKMHIKPNISQSRK